MAITRRWANRETKDCPQCEESMQRMTSQPADWLNQIQWWECWSCGYETEKEEA